MVKKGVIFCALKLTLGKHWKHELILVLFMAQLFPQLFNDNDNSK